MRTFIYTIEKRNANYGCNYSTRIYSVENNKPTFITQIRYNSGAYRGHIHEVFNALCGLGEISQEIAALTTQKRYFYGSEIMEHINIIELS